MTESYGNIHEGTLKSVTGNKLVWTCSEDKNHSYILAADVKVTCRGKVCNTSDLKPGAKIRITTRKDDVTVATHVEAPEKTEACSNTHDGKMVSLSGNKLVTTGPEGKVLHHTVSTDAKVTCDGMVRKIGDLKAGMKIRMTTKETNKNVVTGVEFDKHS